MRWIELTEDQSPPDHLFHGTSQKALDLIRAGDGDIQRVYSEANVSLGGAYFTEYPEIARVAAIRAARAHDSQPVLLTVRMNKPLFPDEDWVVKAAEDPLPEDFDWSTEEYRDSRYRGFFKALFSKYLGDGHSLSDEYARKYAALNKRFKITWKDSLRYIGAVRQETPISPDQIIDIEPVT